ncbi:transglycosylase domain-containing protein [Aromatoleum toluolicum]|uniref:peptidoglycan glycosyltransferase n=1 Tax=Aromatoleum toluolicum TaxID=90060 RepID=A0ABX1NIM9_9RHOO|nr:transglycosylase domain-containing protein [Aromatoleum toluolicum]NMF99181.1 transglycosylase domain-containing protein [Aromatoleum toluolicum]
MHAGADVSGNTSNKKSERRGWFRTLRRSLFWLCVLAIIVGGVAAYYESETSWLQSREIPRYAAKLSYALQPGPSEAIRFPEHGPFDLRLGYTQLRDFSERLAARGYAIERQARFSDALLDYAGRGYFPPYREKTHTGLAVSDARGEALYATHYPIRHYDTFDSIPPRIVQGLLFIENRDLLDPERPHMNPAVDWARFGRAIVAQLAKVVDDDLNTPGGSTLATQIEKYRHSPDGVTHSPREKLRQMVSASVRAYRDGAETLPARRDLVLDYLNTVPLSAAPVYGEVHGLGDGLWVWFGADFARVNALLAKDEASGDELAEQGLALRQVLALMIAHRRPSHYLGRGRDDLAKLADAHLRILAEGGLIGPGLRDAGLKAKLAFRDPAVDPARVPVPADKGSTLVRTRIAGMLDVSLYDLDRLDLRASTTLDGKLQEVVTGYLQQLAEPEFGRNAGIIGERLLTPAQLDKVHYSFTLFERTPGGNRVRVQTDTTDQPLDINEGSKLELGSTAKLRVLATYLEIVAELHQRHAAQSVAELRAVQVDRHDAITRWAIDYLIRTSDRNLPAMLEAALERPYSAGPGEAFFTGGGLHTFNNFRKEDDSRVPTIRQALQASINLPFVRLMRDVVRHTMYQVPGSTAKLLQDDDDPRRSEYLAKFADREAQVFMRRFWRKYKGQSPEKIRATFMDGLRPSADRLAATYRYLNPEADLKSFSAFVAERLPAAQLGEERLAALYKRYAPGSFDLPDQGFIARVHPLELWLAGYLATHPEASFDEVVAASKAERQAVYRWLFRTRYKGAQDTRIYTILEVEAFLDIHRRWVRLGYPFNRLVPSLATALGSAGDRPAALAELMGIIVNDGVRLPSARIDRLHFAPDTPYETVFARRPSEGERVMSSEVATALRGALSEVVEGGTARRLAGAFAAPDGTPIVVGGKTGTGDNRIVISGARGQVKGGVAMNRTATFVFYLGPRHFGTLTAYVIGADAASFKFTSGLPVQILKSMAPTLLPYLTQTVAEPEPARVPPTEAERDADASAEEPVRGGADAGMATGEVRPLVPAPEGQGEAERAQPPN